MQHVTLKLCGNWFYFGPLARGGVGLYFLCSWFFAFFLFVIIVFVFVRQAKLTQFQLYRARSATLCALFLHLPFFPFLPFLQPLFVFHSPRRFMLSLSAFYANFQQTTRKTTGAAAPKTLLWGNFCYQHWVCSKSPKWTPPAPPFERPWAPPRSLFAQHVKSWLHFLACTRRKDIWVVVF